MKAYSLMCLETNKIIQNKNVVCMVNNESIKNNLEMCPSGRIEGPTMMVVVVDKYSKSSVFDGCGWQ